MRLILLGIFALSLGVGSLGALSLGGSAFAQDAVDASQSTDFLSKPPITIRKGPTCQCPDEVETNVLTLVGLVIDAEVTLAPDGQSINDRQATIFDIIPSTDNDYKGRTKIWHSSNKAQCGVSFNYGAKYKLTLRKTGAGALETDACLMKQAKAAG